MASPDLLAVTSLGYLNCTNTSGVPFRLAPCAISRPHGPAWYSWTPPV